MPQLFLALLLVVRRALVERPAPDALLLRALLLLRAVLARDELERDELARDALERAVDLRAVERLAPPLARPVVRLAVFFAPLVTFF